jgi:hypothetical protein
VKRIPWHVVNAEEFKAVLLALETEFPYLHLGVRDSSTVLIGDLPLVLDGRVVESFAIEVVIPQEGMRHGIPVVREVGGRIPWIADRHVYPDGRACLFIEAEYWFKHPSGMDLVAFLRAPVMSYFIGQAFYEQEQRWPFGERSHGALGVVEFYSPLIGSREPRMIKRLIEMVVAKKMRSTWRCPCGSGRRLRGCHGDVVRKLRQRIKRSAAITSLFYLDREFFSWSSRSAP